MLSLFRWMLRLTIGAMVLAIATVTLVWYFATRSLPDYQADLSVSGITAPVEIVRSTEAVPHIFATSNEDAFFALGLVHAQDRLFQMLMMRRAAQGRLAEVYGPGAYAQDDLARRLGLARRANASYAAQDAATKAALNAYAAGVNEWVRQVNLGARGRGAPEFFVYPGAIAYWKPADSLAVLKLLAASSSTALRDEVMRARLSLALPTRGPEVMAQGALPRMPAYASLFPDLHFPAPQATGRADRWHRLAGWLAPGDGIGGNLWAAAADRTVAGGALLANDPQLGLTAPGLFYLARLQIDGRGVIGATVPGIPAVLSGRSQDMAWGLTPAGIDDTDIAMTEVQPGAPDSYLAPQGWRRFTTRTEVIAVDGEASQSITLRETDDGPVLPGGHFGLRAVTPQGHVAALRWTGLSVQDTSMSALIGLMRAKTPDQARQALDQMVAPALSVGLADAQGVTRLLAGAVPQRDPASRVRGQMPVPARDRAEAWTGLTTAAQPQPAIAALPQMVASVRAGTGSAMTEARLTRLLSGREVHSRDSFIDTQLDTISPAARRLLPLVGANLWFTGEPAAPGTPQRRRQQALTLLAEWDGSMNEHLPEPLIYAAWMAQLQNRLIRDELGPLSDDITAVYPDFIDRVFRNAGGAAAWCDVVQSAPQEDCTTIARQALDAAIVDLTARFGGDVASWRWGDMHQARQIHPALGRLPGMGWVVNLTQSVSGGDFTLARGGLSGDGGNPWQSVTGAGYRGVYDLADPDSSVFITSTGQSGHPLSRHYDDLSERWRRGEYISMSLDPGLARAAAAGITHLTPETAP
ncbi:penicillin acylase family protein [Paracoccus jiaweipingae]|uniref:penicillin acylase family protein n=1 Tax=unclassified Paracoccus (in: a-proteobacteria) TaxID=2688777 RepID=UPI0037876611